MRSTARLHGVKWYDRTNDDLERIWKEAIAIPSRYDNCVCLEGLRKAMKTLILAYVVVEIRTAHLPNTSQERYRYANPLSSHGCASIAAELLGTIRIPFLACL
jgi:hypothetical protein